MNGLKRNDKLSPKLSPEKLIQHLAAEGATLLAAEENPKPTKVVGKIQSKETDEVKLTETLGLTSKNPYIRARVQILMAWMKNPKTAWKAREIESMEKGQIPMTKHYDEFVKTIADLGDQLSNQK